MYTENLSTGSKYRNAAFVSITTVMQFRAFYMRSGGEELLWCPGLKSHYCITVNYNWTRMLDADNSGCF